MPRPTAGRPTRARAAARHTELLEAALTIFLEKGYELATIEMIAAAVGMTKRTIYANYEDKSALFKASVRRAIEQYSVSMEDLRAVETDDLETSLHAVAKLRLRNVMTPTGLKLQRILAAASFRFPEMLSVNNIIGVQPTVAFLADLLRRHAAAGNVVLDDFEMAARIFLTMTLTGRTWSMWLGQCYSEEEVDAQIRGVVTLFLNGIKPR